MYILEVTDVGALGISGSERHKKIIDHLLPTASRYRLIWKKLKGRRPLFAWEPVPPSAEYVALGHVITTGTNAKSARPAADAVRCVPRSWVTKTSAAPLSVWTDVGSAGEAGALWKVGGMGHVVATSGHDAPPGPFFDIVCTSFLCTSDLRVVPTE